MKIRETSGDEARVSERTARTAQAPRSGVPILQGRWPLLHAHDIRGALLARPPDLSCDRLASPRVLSHHRALPSRKPRPVPLFRATVVLADLAAVLPDWPALAALAPADLEAALTAHCRFLHPEVGLTVEGGLARVHCSAPRTKRRCATAPFRRRSMSRVSTAGRSRHCPSADHRFTPQLPGRPS